MSIQNTYPIIVITVAFLRVVELIWSKRNSKRLMAKGAFEIRGRHFTTMKLIHTFWLLSCLVEFLFFPKVFHQEIFLFFFALVIIGMILRYLAIATLGERWTVTIWIVPGAVAVRKGIYRYIKHPNYLGVIIEIFALPLMVQSYVTAIVFTILNAIVLRIRIPSEEMELSVHSNYKEIFGDQNRFFPKAAIND